MFDFNVLMLSIALAIIFGLAIYNFVKLGRDKQIAMAKEWLLLAVIEAEKQLGEGTGQIKLRYVYDLFINKFKYLAFVLSFQQFSVLVDEALDKMRKLIESNELIKSYTSDN